MDRRRYLVLFVLLGNTVTLNAAVALFPPLWIDLVFKTVNGDYNESITKYSTV